MKKKIISLLMAVVVLLGVGSAGVFSASAESDFSASDDCIRILKLEEGFSAKPYWDYSQYTIGYGTKCPDDMLAYYKENGITEEEAEVLLRNHLTAIEKDINQRIIDKYALTLTQNQFDALVLFSYNVGTGWTYNSSQNIHQAIATGATGNDLIHAFGRWCVAGGQVQDYLIRRRLCEANMYLNGVYSQTPPDNYCYVLFNANGGTAESRVQTYDSDLAAQIVATATYTGYTFQGWYTQPVGGTQVTVLDASAKGATLYAHWADAEGKTPDANMQEVNLTVTVTGTEVNIRSGPGTNYTRVGSLTKDDRITLTRIYTTSTYTWGCFEKGWIALNYTNYDQVKDQEPQTPVDPDTTEPEDTTPPATEPEETVPPTTEPPATEPPATEPPATEPEETVPPTTEPEEPVTPMTLMGTVKVNDVLRIRSGAGTGYTVVGTLKNGARVEILEQKTVGTMVWGKMSKGWISMNYVVLDKTDTSDNTTSDSNTATTLSGTVNATGGLRIRTGPGVNYSIAGYYDNGAKVTITEQKTVGSVTWGKTAKGWISMNYVVLSSTGNTSGSTGNTNGGTGTTGGSTTSTVKGTVKVSDVLRVRTGPGTSYAIAGYLNNGATVEITEQKTVGATVWGKTSKGWVSMDYIVVSGGTTDTTTTKTVTADCLRVRSSAGTSGSVVAYLYKGAKVQILETTTVNGTEWGRISTGWICLSYTK